MSSFLETLGRNDALARKLAGREDAADPASSWFATHPRTPDRVLRAAERAGGATDQGRLGREPYLAEIDGMIYGEDPRQGFVRGRSFVHPELGIAFEAPPGFQLVNTPAAVIGRGPDGLMKFDGARAPAGRSMADYVARDWAGELGAGGLRDVAPFQVDGMPAASATIAGRLDDGRPVTVALAAVRTGGDRVYRFMFISPGGLRPAQARAYAATLDSFRRLSAADAGAIKPRRIEIVTVAPGQATLDLASRMAVDALPREQFEVLNGLGPGQPVVPGEEVKLIVE
jgi:predicted Zn-dependent protease